MRIGFGLPVSRVRGPRPATSAGSRSGPRSWATTRSGRSSACSSPPIRTLDPVYRSVLDPLVTLAFAAARTTRIRLGVAVVNLPFVSPTYLAKQAATLDVLSGGRLDLGLGTGWAPVEFAATGSRPAAPRRAHRGVPGRAAHPVDRRGQRVRRRVLHRAAGPDVPEAGAATRPAGAARRLGGGGAAPGRPARRRLDQPQRARPRRHRRRRRDRARRGRRRRPRPQRRADRLPGRAAARRALDAAVGHRRAGARRRRVARYAGRHRGLLRPELGSAGRLARRRPGPRDGARRGDPRRAAPRVRAGREPSNRPSTSRYSSIPTPFGSRMYRLSSTPRSGPRYSMPSASSFARAASNCSAPTDSAMCCTPPMVSWNGGWSWPGKSKNPSRFRLPTSKKKWLDPA